MSPSTKMPELKRINLETIIFDYPMRNTLRRKGKEINTTKFRVRPTGTFGQLGRFENTRLAAITEHTNYKNKVNNAEIRNPVKLQKLMNGNNAGYYKIVNGRHRIAMSYLKGFKTIGAILV